MMMMMMMMRMIVLVRGAKRRSKECFAVGHLPKGVSWLACTSPTQSEPAVTASLSTLSASTNSGCMELQWAKDPGGSHAKLSSSTECSVR